MPQSVDPVVSLAPARISVLSSGVRVLARGGVAAEELDTALLGVERTHRVGEELLGDVAFGVDDEAVVAEAALLRRPTDQVAEVDPARGELLEDADQAAGLVCSLVDDERGAVM